MPQRSAFGKKGIIKLTNRNIPLFQSSNIPNPKFDIGGIIIEVNPRYYRPTEVAYPFGKLLIGNPAKAKVYPPSFWREKLGWEAKTEIKDLVKIMVKSDLGKVLKKG